VSPPAGLLRTNSATGPVPGARSAALEVRRGTGLQPPSTLARAGAAPFQSGSKTLSKSAWVNLASVSATANWRRSNPVRIRTLVQLLLSICRSRSSPAAVAAPTWLRRRSCSRSQARRTLVAGSFAASIWSLSSRIRCSARSRSSRLSSMSWFKAERADSPLVVFSRSACSSSRKPSASSIE